MNPVGMKIVSYLPDRRHARWTTGQSNFSMTDLLPNKA